MASFSLDDIRAAAEAKYASTDIDFANEAGEGRKLVLVNALRLPKDKRNTLMALQDEAEKDGEVQDQEEVLADIIRLVASHEGTANEFLACIGDDLAVLAMVFESYTKATQVGEA